MLRLITDSNSAKLSPCLHTTASAVQHEHTWAAGERVARGTAAAAEPQQYGAPSRLTVLIQVSYTGFTGCVEFQTSFSRLTDTFPSMTASLMLAQVCSTLCCRQLHRYKQIFCVWARAEWSVQFCNTSEHPIAAIHTGQCHSHFWHFCNSKLDWTNKTKAFFPEAKGALLGRKNEYVNSVVWIAVYQKTIPFQAKEISQNYLYIKVCSNFIYITTKNESSKSKESCSSVIYVLHASFTSLVSRIAFKSLYTPTKIFPGTS